MHFKPLFCIQRAISRPSGFYNQIHREESPETLHINHQITQQTIKQNTKSIVISFVPRFMLHKYGVLTGHIGIQVEWRAP